MFRRINSTPRSIRSAQMRRPPRRHRARTAICRHAILPPRGCDEGENGSEHQQDDDERETDHASRRQRLSGGSERSVLKGNAVRLSAIFDLHQNDPLDSSFYLNGGNSLGFCVFVCAPVNKGGSHDPKYIVQFSDGNFGGRR